MPNSKLSKAQVCKRPQHAPEQTYRRISLRRSMLRSSNPLRNAVTSSSFCGICNIPINCAIIKPTKEEPSTSASVRLISKKYKT